MGGCIRILGKGEGEDRSISWDTCIRGAYMIEWHLTWLIRLKTLEGEIR